MTESPVVPAASTAPAADTNNGTSTEDRNAADSGKTRSDVPIICPGHSRPVPDIAFTDFTPDGYLLISACLDNKAMLRDGATGDWIGTFQGHKGAVWCARLNQEATQAVTAAADFSAKLWNALTGDEIHTWSHRHIVKSCCFSLDNGSVYTGGQEKKLRIFDLNQPDTEAAVLQGHEASVIGIVAVNSDNIIVSAGAEQNLRVWDKRTATCQRQLTTTSPVTSMHTSIDGQVIAVSAGKQVLFYDSSNFELIKQFTLEREINSVAYDSHYGQAKFVTGSETELWVRGYDFATGEEVCCNKGHHGPVRSLAFAPTGDSYASGSVDGTIRIWNWNAAQ